MAATAPHHFNILRNDLRKTELHLQKEIELTRDKIRKIELCLQKEIEQKRIEMIRKEIAQTGNKIIIWIGGFLIASGLIQHFFK